MSEDKKLYCKHCWIEVVPVPEPDRRVGKGEPILWKHKTARSATGVPNCGKRLTEEDFDTAIEAED